MRLLDRLTPQNSQGLAFIKLWQKTVETIEDTLNRIRRIGSHTVPTTMMSTTDNGATATIVVATHTRVYADGTSLEVTGTTRTGLTSNTVYAVYYDDTTLAVTAPTYVFTTVIADAQANKAEGRHFCGVIKTPPAASGQTRMGGGVYAAGSAVGGEL